MSYWILDIATTALEDADRFLEPVSAPSNYKDPAKIAAYIAEKGAEQVDKLAMDPDCSRISAIGYGDEMSTGITICKTEDEERSALLVLKRSLMPKDGEHVTPLIGFNSLRFDWPFLMRRALYLDIHLHINLDRYKTPHIDLYDRLTHHGTVQGHSLSWYAKRLGWTDITKPLSGAEEAKIFEHQRWDDLIASVRHDVIACQRLGQWMGILPASDEVIRGGRLAVPVDAQRTT